ncbi:MAG: tRNA (cytidine(34)-2'-O)-methyltransferase [Pirellulales bacterium]|nr:tRNA (cytidine(34)-2'-O)-methyltransferase [Pirellulales bacterium]
MHLNSAKCPNCRLRTGKSELGVLGKPLHLSIRPMHIVLYEPEIAGNTGNVGRTCVALGAKLWLVRPLGFQVEDRHLRRAGMDYWEHLDWEAVDNWEALLRALSDNRLWFFTKTAPRTYLEVEYRANDALVFGGESRGLPPSLLEAHADRCLRIPMRENARSLNLSVSVAVAAYEARRQCEANGRK